MPREDCGETVHAESNDNLRRKRKRGIGRRDLDDEQDYSLYVVKHGLNAFFNPDLDDAVVERLKECIDADVREVSKLMIETSYLVNCFYRHYYYAGVDPPPMNYTTMLHFTYAMKGSVACKLRDDLGFIARYKARYLRGRNYNCTRRNYIIQEACKQYVTNFDNNVVNHMLPRIKKFIKLKGLEKDKNKIHDICKRYYVEGSKEKNAVTEILEQYKLRENLVKMNPSNYLRFLFDLNRLQREKNVKACKPMPTYHQGVQYITYTSSALYELLQSAGEKTVYKKDFNDNARTFWNKYFRVSHLALFNCCFSTDGVAVSKYMNRPKRQQPSDDGEPSPKKAKTSPSDETEESEQPEQIHQPEQVPVERYDRVIAVDPGAKTPIVTYEPPSEEEKLDPKLKDGKWKVLTKGRVNFLNREFVRKRKLHRWTGAVEKKIREDPDSKLSMNGPEYMEAVQFKYKYFDEKQAKYAKKNVRRLRFDKYIRQQQTEHTIVREFFGGGPKDDRKTTILYGNGCRFMNKVQFKGHRKFFHNAIIKCVKTYYKSKLSLQLVNEANTTNTCGLCGEKETFVVSKSPHRYAFCSKCRRGGHRDKNAAMRIYRINWPGLPSPEEVGRAATCPTHADTSSTCSQKR